MGDKTEKYAEGDIVWVTVGKKFAQKKKIYTAMIDRVLANARPGDFFIKSFCV